MLQLLVKWMSFMKVVLIFIQNFLGFFVLMTALASCVVRCLAVCWFLAEIHACEKSVFEFRVLKNILVRILNWWNSNKFTYELGELLRLFLVLFSLVTFVVFLFCVFRIYTFLAYRYFLLRLFNKVLIIDYFTLFFFTRHLWPCLLIFLLNGVLLKLLKNEFCQRNTTLLVRSTCSKNTSSDSGWDELTYSLKFSSSTKPKLYGFCCGETWLSVICLIMMELIIN